MSRIDDARIDDTHTASTLAIHVGQNTRQWNNFITEEKNDHRPPWNARLGSERHGMENDRPERDPPDDFADKVCRYGSTLRRKVLSRHSSTGSKNSKDKKRGGRQRGSHLSQAGAINALAVRKEGACLRCVFQKEKVWRAVVSEVRSFD